ncbi:MAG: hypothetical protein KCHDKBKB_00001 [Elusimicrobia bacterium]|nr:hypothetical protein [Elusimicrobiota bacterium]
MIVSRSIRVFLLGFPFVFIGILPSQASRAQLEKPYLTSDLQEKLENLPYGLSAKSSLFLRIKHIETVQFLGAATPSRFSFKRGQSILHEGLSLRLLQNSKGGWANGVIQLKKPLDVRKYNSIVVWVWTSLPNMRLSLRLKSGSQIEADALPTQGFPPNEPIQLVIPFSRFSSKDRLNFSKLQQIILEFGQETTGNPSRGVIQVLGVAFVEQSPKLKRSILVLGRSTTKVVLAEPMRRDEPGDDSIDEISGSKTVRQSAPSTITAMGKSVKAFLSMSEKETAEFFRGLGLNFTGPQPTRPVEIHPEEPRKIYREWIADYSRGWPLIDSRQIEVVDESNAEKTGGNMANVFYFLFLLSLATLWFFLLRRGHVKKNSEKSAKIFHEVVWPFSITQPVLHRKIEREFWKGVSAQQSRFGWLSTSGLVMERASPSEYFGEPFLFRQIELADKAGVTLFPSLSFSNVLFRKDSNQPNMEWSGVALRSLVTDTINRFADVASGARIENAVEFLDPKLRRSGQYEFWADVIASVRAKKPHFIFIADAVGDHVKLMRDVGFDFYENDRVVSILLDQLQEGRVGDVQAFLRGKSAQALYRSIFNLSPLVKPCKNDLERHRKILAVIILTLLPGIIQHDNNLPDELVMFIDAMAKTMPVRFGEFVLLPNGNSSVISFARWWKKSMIIAVGNFSQTSQEVMVRLDPIQAGIDNNKLYLFENALHGAPFLKSHLNQPNAGEPALALWGQNLRETGLPLNLAPLSLTLFAVSLNKSLGRIHEEIEPSRQVPALN